MSAIGESSIFGTSVHKLLHSALALSINVEFIPSEKHRFFPLYDNISEGGESGAESLDVDDMECNVGDAPRWRNNFERVVKSVVSIYLSSIFILILQMLNFMKYQHQWRNFGSAPIRRE